jgi:hypothetical protein
MQCQVAKIAFQTSAALVVKLAKCERARPGQAPHLLGGMHTWYV